MGSSGIPASVLARAQGVAGQYTALTGVAVDAAEILTGRAALLALAAPGRVSAGGATRLLPARDRWCAVNLSRPDDIAAIPALLNLDTVGADPWQAIEAWTRDHAAAELVGRARLLGIPAAVLGETPSAAPRVRPLGVRRTRPLTGLLVADLSSMWAGPLCGQLLARAGALVVKVEHPARPDGTRAGSAAFFDWMNSGKLSYAADFDDPGLARLLVAADVVIEASRPGALARRGLGPDTVRARDGRVWLRITGHGADGECADWPAFGDDAAVSGGLVGYRDGAPVFVGDAIADPLTGLEAARAVAASLARGGAEVIECTMASVAAGYAAFRDGPPIPATAPPAAPAGPALGADNATVCRLVSERVPC